MPLDKLLLIAVAVILVLAAVLVVQCVVELHRMLNPKGPQREWRD